MSLSFILALLGLVIGWRYSFWWAIAGGLLGHYIGNLLKPKVASRGYSGSVEVKESFIKTTFSIMGYIAKSDGVVTKKEIDLAERVIAHFGLSQERRKVAISYFNDGKTQSFDLERAVMEFRGCCRSSNLYRLLLDILFQVAYADGELHPNERTILVTVANYLGISQFEFVSIEALARMRAGAGRSSQGSCQGGSASVGANDIDTAYKVLGVSSGASDQEVKKAYRSLIGKNHPDKLIAKGLPEDMVDAATEKSQQITRAYDLIMEYRKDN